MAAKLARGEFVIGIDLVPPRGLACAEVIDEAKAAEAKRLAEEALRNAKSDIDIARAQSELAVHAAQIAALRKFLKK